MKFTRPLTEQEQESLQHLHKHGPTHRERQRAQAILLSARGYTIEVLSDIFSVHRDVVSRWIDLFHSAGIAGLGDAPKTGRPSKLDDKAQALISQQLQHPSPNLKNHLLATLKKTV